MKSFDSLMNLLESKLKSYIDNNQPITNGKFNQEDIDKWRIWHPCPIQSEYWHDDMLNYISFDVTFADSNPIVSMHFTIDELIITCSSSPNSTVNTYSVDGISDSKVNTEKLITYLRVSIKIIENLFPIQKPVGNDEPLCHVLQCDSKLV